MTVPDLNLLVTLNVLIEEASAGIDIREVLALNLKTSRRARGLSQEELAHRAGIDRTYISSLERCIYAAGIDVVDRLAKVLGSRSLTAFIGVDPPSPQRSLLAPSG